MARGTIINVPITLRKTEPIGVVDLMRMRRRLTRRPFRGAGAPGFEVGDALLLEIGDFILLESGDKILIDF